MDSCAEKLNIEQEQVQKLHQLNHHKTYLRMIVFLVLYFVSGYSAYMYVMWMSTWWAFLLIFPLYIIAGASLHGISLFTHEGVHGVLSRNRLWNHTLSALCAMPVLQNFAAYRVLHLKHHRHLGLEGDPDHYDNYTNWTWLVFAMHWGRLILGYPAYITAIPILGFQQGNIKDRFCIFAELMVMSAIIWAICISPLSWTLLLHMWLIPMIIINTMVNIRGMSQHTLLEHESDTIKGTRTILTNPVTTFFMCNENYHLEHHLYPNVPWYNLPAMHRELKDDLTEKGAPYIPSYFAFVYDFIVASIKRSPAGSVVVGKNKV
ncbi:fatty acid desaturase [Candidatus Uabimicrobium sp. HlEnr_7]|uniref:fatty acid desaturase family protein n=1 Tax=Candidatus Uabimicrobium helgolandensis TaxID=3095367 RepID=UPI003557C0E4